MNKRAPEPVWASALVMLEAGLDGSLLFGVIKPGLLVGKNLVGGVAAVLLTDDDVPEVAEQGHLVGQQVQGDAARRRHGPALPHQAIQVITT